MPCLEVGRDHFDENFGNINNEDKISNVLPVSIKSERRLNDADNAPYDEYNGYIGEQYLFTEN